ncbi:sex-determining region Y protein [Cryptotermes secundus]|uniref:sex-determining region Y protein n=1 Tax=Cryptotermes secundus TaxID=105785 RepID=UPI000CD7C500|nr:sex-determining region Y protein [Cryptotermes secundus]
MFVVKEIQDLRNSGGKKMEPSQEGRPACGNNIKRPPNAYILFAKEWRKKIAALYTTERSTDISIRLGNMWHSLTSEEKQKYFDLGRLTAQEHGQRYPDYSYNPLEARRQKAAHVGAHRVKGTNPSGHKATNTLGVSGKVAHSRHSPATSRIFTKEDVRTSPCPQSMNDVRAAVNCDTATLMDDQQLPYVQAPGLEITSLLKDSADVASLVEFVQLELPKWDFLFQLNLINTYYANY